MIAAAQLMLVLDDSIVNIALPNIQQELGVDPVHLPWIVNAYILAFGALLLLGGRIGDLYGRRRVLQAGLAIFVLASLAGGIGVNSEMLIAARAIQGLGAALVAPNALALITTTFSDRKTRDTALSLYGAMSGLGIVVGLLLGGFLTGTLGWRWVFFINVPSGSSFSSAAETSSKRTATPGPSTSGARCWERAAWSPWCTPLPALVRTASPTRSGWGSSSPQSCCSQHSPPCKPAAAHPWTPELVPGPRIQMTVAADPLGPAPNAETPAAEPQPAQTTGKVSWLRRPATWLAAAAAAAVVTTGVVVAVNQTVAPVPLASARLERLDGFSATGSATVTETSDGSRTIEVQLDKIEARGYQEVWLIAPDLSRLVSLGIMNSSSGRFDVPAGLDLSGYPIVDISDEPLDGNPAHSSVSIVRGT